MEDRTWKKPAVEGKERTDAKKKEKRTETTKENPGGAWNDVVRDGSGCGRS